MPAGLDATCPAAVAVSAVTSVHQQLSAYVFVTYENASVAA